MPAREGARARAARRRAAERYGAPYWVIHRGDLQTALREAVETRPEIALKLGVRVDDFAARERHHRRGQGGGRRSRNAAWR